MLGDEQFSELVNEALKVTCRKPVDMENSYTHLLMRVICQEKTNKYVVFVQCF